MKVTDFTTKEIYFILGLLNYEEFKNSGLRTNRAEMCRHLGRKWIELTSPILEKRAHVSEEFHLDPNDEERNMMVNILIQYDENIEQYGEAFGNKQVSSVLHSDELRFLESKGIETSRRSFESVVTEIEYYLKND